MNCPLCGAREITKHPQDVKSIICSTCVQVLSFQTQEALKKAYQLALEKGMPDKAKALETFLEKEQETYVPETRNLRSRLVGARLMRQAKCAS